MNFYPKDYLSNQELGKDVKPNGISHLLVMYTGL